MHQLGLADPASTPSLRALALCRSIPGRVVGGSGRVVVGPPGRVATPHAPLRVPRAPLRVPRAPLRVPRAPLPCCARPLRPCACAYAPAAAPNAPQRMLPVHLLAVSWLSWALYRNTIQPCLCSTVAIHLSVLRYNSSLPSLLLQYNKLYCNTVLSHYTHLAI